MTAPTKPRIKNVEVACAALHAWLRAAGLTNHKDLVMTAFLEDSGNDPAPIRPRSSEIRRALRRAVATRALLQRWRLRKQLTPAGRRAALYDDTKEIEILIRIDQALLNASKLTADLDALLAFTHDAALKQLRERRFQHVDTARLGRDVTYVLQAIDSAQVPLEQLKGHLRLIQEADACRSKGDWNDFVAEMAASFEKLGFPLPEIASLLGEEPDKRGCERIRARLNRLAKRPVPAGRKNRHLSKQATGAKGQRPRRGGAAR